MLAAVVPALPSTKRRQCEAADLVSRLALAVEPLLSAPIDRVTERRLAEVLVTAIAAFEDVAGAVGLEPLPRGTPAVVSLRWLARLAERTAGRNVRLGATPLAALAGIVADVESWEPQPPAAAAVCDPVSAPARSAVPAHLLGAR